MTYTVYLLPDRRGLYRAYANAPPAGQESETLVLRIRGDLPPDLPEGPMTLQGLMDWTARLGEQGCTLGEIEGPRRP